MNKQYDKWQDAVSDLTTDKYDNDFKKIEGLKWLPWVGKNYDSTKIFILGASHYEWIKQGSEGYQDMKDSVESKEFTREVVARHGVMIDKLGRNTFGNFCRCLLDDNADSIEDRKELWNSVLFYNLLQEPMVDGTKTVVTDDNGPLSWEVFKNIIAILKPNICIVWGVEVLDHWASNCMEFRGKYEYKEKVGGSSPREATITIDGHEVPICVIHHPSQNFSHTQWREYLLSQHKDKLNKIITG